MTPQEAKAEVIHYLKSLKPSEKASLEAVAKLGFYLVDVQCKNCLAKTVRDVAVPLGTTVEASLFDTPCRYCGVKGSQRPCPRVIDVESTTRATKAGSKVK